MEFKLNSLASVKEEVDTDFHYQVSNYTTTSMNPYLKDDSKLTYGLLEEKPSTSTANFKCLVGEGLGNEVSPTASDKKFEEQIGILSTMKEENSSNTHRVFDNKIKSLQKLGALKDVCSFECRICKKSFLHKYNLFQHIKSHPNNRPHQCDICGKSFQLKHHLNEHLLTHTDNRPFKCDVCNKSFSDKGNLNRHLLIHTDSHPFKCEICNKSFGRKSNLKSHLLTHSDSRPFKCNLCNKSFSQKSNLNRHLLIHTDSLPFKCDLCNKCFRNKTKLNLHLLTYSKSRPVT
ncbi:hypothetical protein C0J52_26917 [Blattella germanica]|nr:hypothetical protein C0J52_26917 [Blattella germanica]